jgi:hypothetical protein
MYKWGPCPVFYELYSIALLFAYQLRDKHGKNPKLGYHNTQELYK